MASGQWWRVVWDNSPIPVPAVGLAMRAITMMIGLGGRTACGEPGDADINTDHSSTCTAETSRISKLNYDFLNRPSRDQLQSLKIAKVCNHYRKRYEEQIRGGTYKGLSCPSSSTGGELISTVGEGNAAVERRLKYNDQGVLHNIELRFAHTPGGVNLVELVNSAPTKVTNREPVEKLRGRRTTTLPIELVGPSYPAFNELAALKLESAELISCCRIKDTSLLRQCRDGFNTPARGPPDLIETGGAVK